MPFRYTLATLLFTLVLATIHVPDTGAMVPPTTIDQGDGPGTPRGPVQAVRLFDDIDVDGKLEEGAWLRAVPFSHFVQRDPVEGAEPTEETVVYVLFDDEALYVGARMNDAAPDSIVARLGRRDAELEADRFGFFVDPYDDNRTGFYFGVNAAGTLYDGVLMNDDWDDSSWDGVWEGKAHVDDHGWTAELRIPYSQLRFVASDNYTWGVNFRRDISRKNERDFLVYTPRNGSGFVSRFVDLVGIENIEPPRQMEVTPYVTARAAFTDHDAGDPFNDGTSYRPGAGADFKIGITNNLTLNGAINPDFGQVEVDPAVVNLSDVETFFPEKRSFFVDGASIFEFGRGGSNNNWSFNFAPPTFFYSRRIGRAPQGSIPDADFADMPEATNILGATKLTGKVQGWNVGMIHAVTSSESAIAQTGTNRFRAQVEPLAYYGVYRGLREMNDGRQAIGFLSTVAARDFGDGRLRDEIDRDAYTLGLDGWTFLDHDKTWVVNGWLGMSHVRGTAARMLALQESSQHYFQRPDAGHVHVDSSSTSLTGLAGRVMLNKQSGRFYVNSALGFIQPSFDVNDLGFQWRTDVINGHLVLGYRWSEPRAFYRDIEVYSSVFRSMDFDGNTTWQGVWAHSSIQFKNYYRINLGGAYNPESINNSLTRGGPLTLNEPAIEQFGFFGTDSRKAWVFGVEYYTHKSSAGDATGIGLSTEWHPAANISLSVNPSLDWNADEAQYVDAFDDPLAAATYGRRYVFASLDQRTVSSSIRLNWTFSPEMSLQLYAQPFISSGSYTHFKELARPKSFDFVEYGQDGSTFDAGTRMADPDGTGPAPAFELPQQDFNFRSLRGTAVLRWEYLPGSTLFLVWTQTRSDTEDDGTFQFDHSVRRLFNARPDNIFMVKLTYWLSR